MAHIFQVGVGSGGMVVLDLLARDERIRTVTLIDPDIYQPHNVVRHYFPSSAAGQAKVDLARDWLQQIRPDLQIFTYRCDFTNPARKNEIEAAAAGADLGICAVDTEPAKYQFDYLMRRFRKPWCLGEVLSGGIGGWVHVFRPDQACYGCVASRLKRESATDLPSSPIDYANVDSIHSQSRLPASKAAITTIASLHALVALDILAGLELHFTSMLMPLLKVDNVFTEPYKRYLFRIPRSEECLICCQAMAIAPTGNDLDVVLDQALARLDNE